jgi:hypothetical protein
MPTSYDDRRAKFRIQALMAIAGPWLDKPPMWSHLGKKPSESIADRTWTLGRVLRIAAVFPLIIGIASVDRLSMALASFAMSALWFMTGLWIMKRGTQIDLQKAEATPLSDLEGDYVGVVPRSRDFTTRHKVLLAWLATSSLWASHSMDSGNFVSVMLAIPIIFITSDPSLPRPPCDSHASASEP